MGVSAFLGFFSTYLLVAIIMSVFVCCQDTSTRKPCLAYSSSKDPARCTSTLFRVCIKPPDSPSMTFLQCSLSIWSCPIYLEGHCTVADLKASSGITLVGLVDAPAVVTAYRLASQIVLFFDRLRLRVCAFFHYWNIPRSLVHLHSFTPGWPTVGFGVRFLYF